MRGALPPLNTFGEAGVNIGQSVLPTPGIGMPAQGWPAPFFPVAVGRFFAPRTNGHYKMRIENAYVNYLVTVGGPGVVSQVASALVESNDVEVWVVGCPLDFNGDGVLDQEDLGGFLSAFLSEPSAWSTNFDYPGFAVAPCPDQPSPYNDFGYLADYTNDCVVDQEDLSAFLTDYFAQIESPSPECSPPP